MSDDKLVEHLANLVSNGKFAEWYLMKAKDVTYEAAEEYKAARGYFLHLASTTAQENKIERLSFYARKEAEKNLVWTDEKCEAEKYLASVRQAVGQAKGRFPWCGSFVYWCCKVAGFDFPAAFTTGFTAAYVPGWEAWARANKTWYSSRLKASEFNPKAGDIVVFDWNDDAVADHIGIVLDYDGKRTLTTAEGNTSAMNNSNGNSTAVRTRDWNVCKGFIRLV